MQSERPLLAGVGPSRNSERKETKVSQDAERRSPFSPLLSALSRPFLNPLIDFPTDVKVSGGLATRHLITSNEHLETGDDNKENHQHPNEECETKSPEPSAEQFKLDVETDLNPCPFETERILENLLGKGAVGLVYKAEYLKTCVAVKVYHDVTVNTHKILRECEIMTKLHYKHVARLFGFSAFTTPPCLVMELAEKGSLCDLLKDKEKVPNISWLRRLQIARDAALGIMYLHRRKIFHRDLKSANILLRKDWTAFIADFGLAKAIIPQISITGKGSWPWMPPEMMYPSDFRGSETFDIYSFGMVLYELLTRCYPFEIEKYDLNTIKIAVVSGRRPTIPVDYKKYSSMEGVQIEYLLLIKECCRQLPEDRLTLDKILSRLEHLIVIEEIMSEIMSVLRVTVPITNANQEILNYFLPTETDLKNFTDDEAFSACQDAALFPISWAQLRLAHMYRQSIGTDQSHSKAFQYYRLASKNSVNNLLAENWIAFYYIHELSPYKNKNNNYKKGFHISQIGVKNHIPLAYSNLGYCYQFGKNVEKDIGKAIYYYQEGVKLNDPYAQSYLGRCYEMGKGVEINLEEAIHLYKLGANQNCSLAQLSLGNYYKRKNKLSKAVQYYQLAAKQGEFRAQSNLGQCYHFGKGIKQDIPQAIKWYLVAAQDGNNARCQYRLGHSYEKGLGDLKIDLNQAIDWYQKASDQGYAPAQNELGRFYQEGLGRIEKDMKKAIYYYELAALQNNPRAQTNLGICYEEGLGNEFNYRKALDYYHLAAKQNLDVALFKLGSCYQRGLLGLPKDKQKSFEYYFAAAEQKYGRASYKLGQCYESGYGVEKDLETAKRYFQLSQEQGFEKSKTKLDRLNSPGRPNWNQF